MSTVAEDFLAFCQPLKTSSKEIDLRNCVSRLYYYALHLADRRASELGNPSFAASSTVTFQEGVLKRFKEWRSSMEAVRAGYLLTEMKKRRVVADYLLRDDVQPDLSHDQVEAARRIEDLLSKIPAV